MKNLFIDANIWLNLYHFSGDDLEQFRKLKGLNGTEVRLFITSQVRDEVRRNRDSRIKDSLAKFEKFDFTFPAFCKSYTEYNDFFRDYNSLKQRHKEWCVRIHSDINNQELPADRAIQDFFNSCQCIICTPEVIRKAEVRYRIGNPPGKDNKLGDAINWECLLSSVPNGEDLFFISTDKDYKSALDDQSFNLFLKEEWQKEKHSEVFFFTSLVSFLNAHIKEIELKTEQRKDDLINWLKNSRCFQDTHDIIRQLSEFEELNSQQIDDICYAAINNCQVSWILGDDDVLAFYENLLLSAKEDSANINEVLKMLLEAKNER